MSQPTLRRVARLQRGAGFAHQYQGVSAGDLPFFKVGDFGSLGNERYLHSCDNWVSKETAKNLRAVAVRSGSVLLPKIGAALLGNARRIATQQTVFDNNVLAVVPESINEGYLYYLLSTLDLAQLANPGPIPSLDDSALLDQRVPCGDASEQGAIADYLDTETARIDDLITNKRLLTELFEERVIAMANRIVQGDNRGHLRPTRIPMIPHVPGHWEVRRNKTFMREVNRPSTTGQEEMLSVSHLTGVTPRSEKTVYMFEAESTVGYKLVHHGDLVINTMWAWMGAAGTVTTDGIVSPAYGVYEMDTSIVVPEWFDMLIRTPAYIAEMTRFSRGVTSSRLRLYPDEFLRLSAPVPPLDEQERLIAEFALQTTTGRRACDALERHVELLEEHRQALITAAVTGELPVPGVAA